MKHSNKLFISIALLSSWVFLNTAIAGSVTLDQINSPLQNTTGLSSYATDGADMDGMSFDIGFSDGTTKNAVWAATGVTSGSAAWTGGSLSLSGDSFSARWMLSQMGDQYITDIFIDAGLGDTVFDRTFGSGFGSDGSARGKDFSVTLGGSPYDITTTYSGAVGIGDAVPVGDLFRYALIDFVSLGQAFGGSTGVGGASLSFLQDTDNLTFDGDISASAVPVPAAIWLFGTALLGFVGMSRKTKVSGLAV
jgi:hypothetical protein